MQKDFDRWNEQKKHINKYAHTPYYHEREVRWCRLGKNIGFEQDGSGKEYARPVLILKFFNKQVCFVVPLTTSSKKSQKPYHFFLGEIGYRGASAIVSQARLVDARRLDQKIDTISQDLFEDIKKAVKDML